MVTNVLAHAIMLHGAIAESVLPCGAIAFNAPAWWSLEWQFYLIAPIAMSLALGRAAVPAPTVATLLCFTARHGYLGQYQHLSFLPIAVPFFIVGVASRVVHPCFAGRLRRPAVTLALMAALLPLGWDMAPLLAWGALFALLITDRRGLSGTDAAVRLGSLLLVSPPAMFVGRRSRPCEKMISYAGVARQR
jgi:hypothetical protein